MWERDWKEFACECVWGGGRGREIVRDRESVEERLYVRESESD